MNCNVCGHEITAGAGRSTSKDGFELIRCPQCGLLFRRQLPDRDELDSLYSVDYFQDRDGATGGYADYLGDERLHRSLAARRLARLEGLTSGRRLLDVGAAAGFFVAEATERGWDATGIDVSRPMVDHAAGRGLDVVLGDLDDVRAERFDVVTMWDYIEHSIDPARDIRRCAELLTPGGLVALSTGDMESVVARLSGRHWHLLTPRHHNYFFGRTTIRRLLEAHGFTVLETSHPGARYSLGHIAYKLVGTRSRRLAARTAHRLDRSPVGGLALPVNLFDIMTVLARKHDA